MSPSGPPPGAGTTSMVTSDAGGKGRTSAGGANFLRHASSSGCPAQSSIAINMS